MANVLDVAEYILGRMGSMSTWKLQKLVYYSQAWHLVWEGRPLFSERIRAWANGPVVPMLYHRHKGAFLVSTVGGDKAALKPNEIETIDVVLEHYGGKSPDYLSQLTHMEAPWRNARRGVPDGERSNREITLSAMSEYYSSLP